MHQSRVLTEMNEETLYLWFAYPEDLLTQATEEACFSLLSEQERASSREFKFEHHRREYLTTRALVRTALSQYNPLTPEAWRFKLNSYGRPATDPQCGLMFNLSNCPGLVVCLIAKGIDVGVDAEPDERAEKIEEVASRVFSPAELAQLELLRGRERLDRALSLWTLKEAYAKARGKGLSLSLDKLSFLFGAVEGIRLKLDPCLEDNAEHWRFCLLEHAGHRIAIVAERAADLDLQLFEMRHLMASTTRLQGRTEGWYPRHRGDCDQNEATFSDCG